MTSDLEPEGRDIASRTVSTNADRDESLGSVPVHCGVAAALRAFLLDETRIDALEEFLADDFWDVTELADIAAQFDTAEYRERALALLRERRAAKSRIVRSFVLFQT